LKKPYLCVAPERKSISLQKEKGGPLFPMELSAESGGASLMLAEKSHCP